MSSNPAIAARILGEYTSNWRGYLAHPRSIQPNIRLQFVVALEANTCPQRELSMVLQIFYRALIQYLLRIGMHLEQRFKRWSQPINSGLLPGASTNLTRSKSELILENAFLRQQLIVLRRQTKRPVLSAQDRGVGVLLSSRLRTWREAMLIVKPDTLLRWHRQGFRWLWRQKSRAKPRPPRVPPDVIALIHTLARDNRLWGMKRIQDELRKLGYRLSK